jgi:nitric oxide reductase NorF protein
MMKNTSARLVKAWSLLVALATANALLVGLAPGFVPPFLLASAVIALSLLKARIVILDFLGLREGSALLRWTLLAWPMFLAAATILKLIATSHINLGG